MSREIDKEEFEKSINKLFKNMEMRQDQINWINVEIHKSRLEDPDDNEFREILSAKIYHHCIALDEMLQDM